MGGLGGSDHVGIIARDGQCQQHISRLAECAHLAGKLLGPVAAAPGQREQGAVRSQGHCSQFRPVALKPRNTEGCKLLRLGGRRPVAAGQHFAATGHAGQNGLHGCSDGRAEGLRGLVFQVGAVDKVLLNALL